MPIKSDKFNLPNQQQLYQPGWAYTTMMVDVGQMKIERPKK
ncbi:hypothetical protein [Zarconia navalis]|nr:hypothetical protein [Zarconia navalis]